MKTKIFSIFAAAIVFSGCGLHEEKAQTVTKGTDIMCKESLRTDAPALRFPAIIPIYGDDDENLTRVRSLIKHIHETAGLTEFAVSFPLNPQGKDPYEKVKVYAERFGRLKKLNDIPGIRIGVLMQQTIGAPKAAAKAAERAVAVSADDFDDED